MSKVYQGNSVRQKQQLSTSQRFRKGVSPVSLRIIGCMLILMIIYIRFPLFFTEPRFWAEEGKGYFAFAFSHSAVKSFFAAHYGYFGLVPNVASLLATQVSLETAPLVTTYCAFLIQFLASSYVFFYDSVYWDSFPKKLIVASAIQLLCPFECWLTTVSSQYFLYSVSFFILLESRDVQDTWRKWLSRFLLLVSGLTGPAVTFFLIPYGYKAIRTRLREDWLRTGIVFFSAMLQGFALINTVLNSNGELVERFNSSAFDIIDVVKLHLVRATVGNHILNYVANNYPAYIYTVEFTVSLFLVSYLSLLLMKSCFCKELQLHVISFLSLSIFSVLLSLNMQSSPRAAFAPAVMLVVMLLYEIVSVRNRLWARGTALLVLSAIIFFGISEHRGKVYYGSVLPKWKDEVALWRKDNRHLLMIWPQFTNGINGMWFLQLDPENGN